MGAFLYKVLLREIKQQERRSARESRNQCIRDGKQEDDMDNTQVSRLGLKVFSSPGERAVEDEFLSLLKNCPIPDDEILQNVGLFINSKLLARMLFFHHIYQLQLSIHGVILDFGTRWGQNMAIFSALRGIYEPFNRHRKIIGFDTFEGFPSLSAKDGKDRVAESGGYGVTKEYENYLSSLIACHEKFNPMSHVKRYEIIKGDASQTLKVYLKNHPETMVSLAYLDMDLYEPTRQCLELLKPHLNRGCIIGFDELCDETFPGETVAFREIFGQSYKVNRLPITSRVSYIVLE